MFKSITVNVVKHKEYIQVPKTGGPDKQGVGKNPNYNKQRK